MDGWYYLLTEEVGRKKHLKAQPKPKPVLTTRNSHNIPTFNTVVEGQERIVVSGGYIFKFKMPVENALINHFNFETDPIFVSRIYYI